MAATAAAGGDDGVGTTEDGGECDPFVSSLPEPLRGYASEAFPLRSSAGDGSAGGDLGSRLDRLEVSARSHLLALAEGLLERATEGEADLEPLLRYLKDATLLCSHAVKSDRSKTDPNNAAEEKSPYAGAASSSSLKKLPFLLLEDAADSLPLSVVRTMWSSSHPSLAGLTVESYASELLCRPELFVAPSKFALLRICNKLLKASSNRGADAGFAGKLMTTTARVFPLSERSAVNVLGSFNVDNDTRYETEEEFKGKEEGGEAMDVGDGDAGGSSVGYEFYKTFWGVQKIFADPQGTILPSKAGPNQAQASAAFGDFAKDVASILAALESSPVPASSSATASRRDGARHHKYLTSSQLLRLQLKDATLRVHFLSQLLIIISYLRSPGVALPAGGGGDESSSTISTPSPSRRLENLERRAWDLLRSTSPFAERAARSLKWTLGEREGMWRAWKRNKCAPAMDKVGLSPVGGGEIRKALSSSRERRRGRKRKAAEAMDVGGGQISVHDMPEASMPDAREFLRPYAEACDPENGIDDEYHPRRDTVYCWRALRLVARDHSVIAGVGDGSKAESGDGSDDGSGDKSKEGARNRPTSRFARLRQYDGDLEGIVRDVYHDAGEEVGGALPDDYYEEERPAPDGDGGGGGEDDASVGTTEEDAEAKKEKMAAFERAAMEVEEEILNEEEADEGTATAIEVEADAEKEARGTEEGEAVSAASVKKDESKPIPKADGDAAVAPAPGAAAKKEEVTIDAKEYDDLAVASASVTKVKKEEVISNGSDILDAAAETIDSMFGDEPKKSALPAAATAAAASSVGTKEAAVAVEPKNGPTSETKATATKRETDNLTENRESKNRESMQSAPQKGQAANPMRNSGTKRRGSDKTAEKAHGGREVKKEVKAEIGQPEGKKASAPGNGPSKVIMAKGANGAREEPKLPKTVPQPRAKFTPPQQSKPAQESGNVPKGEQRDTSRGRFVSRRGAPSRSNGDHPQQPQLEHHHHPRPQPDRRGSDRNGDHHRHHQQQQQQQQQLERNRDGGADGHRGGRGKLPALHSQRDSRPGFKPRSRSPPKGGGGGENVPSRKGVDVDAEERRGVPRSGAGKNPPPGKGGEGGGDGGGDRREQTSRGGGGRGGWEPPQGGRGGGRGGGGGGQGGGSGGSHARAYRRGGGAKAIDGRKTVAIPNPGF